MSQLPPVGAEARLGGAAEFQRAAQQVNTALASIGANVSRVSQQVTQSTGQLGQGLGQVSTNVSAATRGISTLTNSLNPLNSRFIDSVKNVTLFVVALQAVHAALGLAADAAKALAGGAAIDFQKQFAGIEAFAQGTQAQLDGVRSLVLNLGRELPVSFEKINEAAAELGKAGASAADLLAGSLRAAVTLIVASQGELSGEQAAQAISTAITGFGRSASEAQHIADVLAAVVQTSVLRFNDLRDSLSALGPVAHQLGFTLEDTSAFIGILADRGIKGSTAGTALRSAFQQLLDPSKRALAVMKEFGLSLTTANGQIVSAEQFIAELTRAFGQQRIATGELTAAEREHALAVLFDSRAVTGITALIDGGVEALDKYREAIGRLTATDLAAKFAAPVSAQFELIKNNVQAVAIAFGSVLLPIISAVAGQIATALRGIDLEPLFAIGEAVRLVVSGQAGLPVLVGLLDEIAGTDVSSTFAAIAAAVQLVGATLQAQVLGPLGQLVATFAGLTAGATGSQQFVAAIQNIAVAIAAAASVTGALISGLNDILVALGQNAVAVDIFKGALLGIVAAPILALGFAFASLALSIGSALLPFIAIGAAVGILAAVLIDLNSALSTSGSAIADVGSAVADAASDVDDFVGSVDEAASEVSASLEGVSAAAQTTADRIGSAGAEAATSFEGVSAAGETAASAFDGVTAGAETAASSIGVAAGEIVGSFEGVGATATATGEAASGAFEGVGAAAEITGGVVAQASGEITGAVTDIGVAALSSAEVSVASFEGVGAASQIMAGNIGQASGSVVANLGTAAQATTPFGQAFVSMAGVVEAAANAVVSAIQSLVLGASGAINSLIDAVNASDVAQQVGLSVGRINVSVAGLSGTVRTAGAGVSATLRGVGVAADGIGGAFDALGAKINTALTGADRAASETRTGFESLFTNLTARGDQFAAVLDRIRKASEANAAAARRPTPTREAIPELGFPPESGGGRGGRGRTPRERTGRTPLENAELEAERTARELADALEKIERETGQRVAKIAEDAAAKVNNELTKSFEDIRKEVEKTTKQLEELDISRAINKDIQARRDGLKQIFEDERQSLKERRDLEDEALKERRRLEDEHEKLRLDAVRDSLRDQHEARVESFRQEQEDRNRILDRADDDEERRIKRKTEQRDRADKARGAANAPQFGISGTGDQASEDRLEDARIARQRAREDRQVERRRKDAFDLRVAQEQSENELKANIKILDDAERARKLANEAEDRATKQSREREDRATKVGEEARQRALDNQLEEEDHQRRIDRIHAERDERIAAVNAELAARVAAIRETALVQVGDVLSRFDAAASLVERVGPEIAPLLDEIRTELLGQAGQIQSGVADQAEAVSNTVGQLPGEAGAALTEAGRKFDQLNKDLKRNLDEIQTNTTDTFGTVTDTIVSDAQKIEAAVKAAAAAILTLTRPNTQVTVSAASTQQQPTAATISSNTGIPLGQLPFAGAFQGGGLVGGAFGQEVLARLHGGELVVGGQQTRALLTAVAAMETMSLKMPRGGALTPQTVNQTYNFEANYAQTQSPATLEMDVRAILAMTQR